MTRQGAPRGRSGPAGEGGGADGSLVSLMEEALPFRRHVDPLGSGPGLEADRPAGGLDRCPRRQMPPGS